MRKAILIIYLFSVAGCVTEQSNNLLNKGYKELKNGHYDKAYSLLLQAEQEVSGNELGYTCLYLGSLTREAGLYQQSINYNSKAIHHIEDHRGLTAAMKNYARVLAITGDMEEAELFYFEAMKQYGNDSLKAAALNSYGLALLQHGHYKKAKDVLNRVVNTGYLQAEAYNNLGFNELKNNNPDSAIYYSSKALDIKELSEAYANIAVAYVAKNDTLSYYIAQKAYASGEWDIEILNILQDNGLLKDSIIYIQQAKIDYYVKRETKQEEYKKEALYYMIKSAQLKNDNQKLIIKWAVSVFLMVIVLVVVGVKCYRLYKSDKWTKDLAKKHFKS